MMNSRLSNRKTAATATASVGLMLMLAITLALPNVAGAGNIDLSTVPPRDQVQLTIYNQEDLTLVRERRRITVDEGENPLQFSWANTLIDPTSVELEFRERAGELRILDTRFPHNRREVLYWNVHSEFSGPVEVEITYFTSGISWEADYVLIADEDEAAGELAGYVRVNNHSGEAYADAEVRLVVGEVNLVEKVRELAQRGIVDRRYRDVRALDGVDRPAVRRAARDMMEEMERAEAQRPAEVAKDDLSEYYLFTIEERQTVPDGWSKRMPSFEPVRPELTVQYRYRPAEYGRNLVRVYLFRNNEEAGLGQAPLPDGTVRIFRSRGEPSLAYQGEQTIRYIPIGDRVELNLGPDPRVTLEQVELRLFRDELWFRRGQERRFFNLEDEQRIERNDRVVGWNTRRVLADRIHNTRDEPIAVQIRRSFEGDVTFRSELDATRHDVRTVQVETSLEPRAQKELLYETITRHGHNEEQRRVRIEEGQVSGIWWRDH